jgi:phosphoglycolate phosphatase-like HAD superfamily hydrolase
LNNIVIFDLDGVITSEEAYWDTAGLVLHELLYSSRYWNISNTTDAYQPIQTAEESRQLSRQVLPIKVIADFKARSVNSNWDTCYCGFCLYLITLLSRLPDISSLLPIRPEQEDWIVAFRRQLATLPPEHKVIDPATFHIFSQAPFQGATGLELINRFNDYASLLLGHPIKDVFVRYGPSWLFCQDLFQEWYLGAELYAQNYHHPPAQTGKPGCIYFEQPLLPLEKMRPALEQLREQGYLLGVATGRPGVEGIAPLKNYDLHRYFAETHIVTHAQAAQAEAELRARGDTTSLVKPHPYQFLRAVDPDYQPGQPPLPRGSFVIVGDTPSDVAGGRAAGALTIAVLTGSHTPEARTMLEQSQPDFIVDDITQVPALLARIDDLITIQRLQFSDLAKAELLLQRWFALHMHLQVDSITLTPKAVSLNSFNGIYRLNGEEYFFKTHVEEQGVLEEYYHAEMLYKAGYNIVRPLRTLHEKGQQMVIYPVVHDPVMFDLMREVETGAETFATVKMLAAAEKLECEHLLAMYRENLAFSSAEEHAHAPIHQLFWHRLTGGRLTHFYAGKQVPLPGNPQQPATSILFEDLLRYHWSLNGTLVTGAHETLGASIEHAKIVLNPEREAMTVIGHGDAHFGNVFLFQLFQSPETGQREPLVPTDSPQVASYTKSPKMSNEVVIGQQYHYRYFDPAFAGRHSVLLDIVKPFFHNVFATWMYFPNEVARDLQLSVELRDGCVFVEHNYVLTQVRRAILETKLEYLLQPLKAWLRSQDALPDDWREIMQLALMCCPLLTINLLNEQRIPPAVCWLGLSLAMEMSNLSILGD